MIVESDPHRIAEQHLDAVTTALMSGSLTDFRARFGQPCGFIGSRHAMLLMRNDRLEDMFLHLRSIYRAEGTVRIERRITHAFFLAPDILLRSHVSRRVSTGGDAGPYYSTFSLLRNVDGVWRALLSQFSDTMSGIDDCPEQVRKDAEDSDLKRADQIQTVLETASQGVLSGDYDRFREAVGVPYILQRPRHVEINDTDEAVHRNFDALRARLAGLGATDLVRVVRFAHGLGDDICFGTFRTFITAQDRLVRPSFPGAGVIIRRDGQWRLLALLNPLDTDSRA